MAELEFSYQRIMSMRFLPHSARAFRISD
uniref:Uncharacterized protein n=1 Tax=Anguilla anguilla TaxID=7936 RepID=A0A0E9VKD7_ANGAN